MRSTYVWIARPLLSQDRARRNARRASQLCAQRRKEREDVQNYLKRVRGGLVRA